jgi:hypothetical protein
VKGFAVTVSPAAPAPCIRSCAATDCAGLHTSTSLRPIGRLGQIPNRGTGAGRDARLLPSGAVREPAEAVRGEQESSDSPCCEYCEVAPVESAPDGVRVIRGEQSVRERVHREDLPDIDQPVG